ncbi:unnamed protein product [Bemisia tabaci]|uniref:Kazal-like domain-containing protein n=1 Tax=Bemisia tabaci TaxID=7038 RepID=A0A9P0AJN5_BEMTA|nr:unnamed protein product [Bemisia tabaci]
MQECSFKMQFFTASLALLTLTAVAQCSPQFILSGPQLPRGRNFFFPSGSSSSRNSVQTPPGPEFSRIVNEPRRPQPGTTQNRQDFDGEFNEPGEDFGDEGRGQNRPDSGAAWDSSLNVNGQNRPHVAENRPVGSVAGTPETVEQNRPGNGGDRTASRPDEFNRPDSQGQSRPAIGNEFNRPANGAEVSRPAIGNEFGQPANDNELSRPASGNEFNRPVSSRPNTPFNQERPFGGNDRPRPNPPPIASNEVNRPNFFDLPYPAFGGNVPFRPDAFNFGRPPFGLAPSRPPFDLVPNRPPLGNKFDYRPGVDCTKTGDLGRPEVQPFNPSRPGPFDRPLFTPGPRPTGNPGVEKNDSSEESGEDKSDEDESGENSSESSEESVEAGGSSNSLPNKWGIENPATPTTQVTKVTQPCSCAPTPEYNPVCGTDNQTYGNPRTLECARVCNRSPGVQLAYHSACLGRPIVPSLSGWTSPPQTFSQSQAQAQSQSSGRRVEW